MKLISESITPENLVLESTVQDKIYRLQGVFSTAERRNRNGRIYPKRVLEKAVNEYKEHIKNKTTNSLLELDHPARSHVEILEAVAVIEDLWWEGNDLKGSCKILNNNSHKTNTLKSLIDNGFKIGISSRGLGSLSEDKVVTDFKLITFDLVTDPSNQTSYLTTNESLVEGVVQDKEFEITEKGEIKEIKVCDKNSCQILELEEHQVKELQNKLLDSFKELINS